MTVVLSHCRVQPLSPTEHQLVATRAVPAGEPLLIEAPMLSIPVGRYAWGTYNWDFVDTLLSDRSLLQRYDRWKLASTDFLLDPTDLAVEAALVRKHRISRARVRALYFNISTNNIGLLDSDEMRLRGYGLFELMSRSDHSCQPSARLAAHNADKGLMALLARRDVRSGEPVTWSYFRENEFLQADFETRNFGLVNNFRFACRCERCQQERPAELAGVRDLVPHFDRLIAQAAAELAQTPDGLAQAFAQSPMAMHRRALGVG